MNSDPLFPACRPRCVRQMAVGDGHLLHVEECGSADGLPVLFLHDGLGLGCQPEHRRLFDPQRYRVVMIDMRGTGRSLPRGELEANTTADLICDIDYVREALAIEQWLVFGTAWGSLLALAYAELYVERVLGLVLSGILFGSSQEIHAYVQDAQCHGDPWQTLAAAMPVDERPELLKALSQRILGSDEAERATASHAWLNYKQELIGQPLLAFPPDEDQLAQARVQMHYLVHNCFISPDRLLAGVDRLRHLPGAIVQGRADPICLTSTAERLHRAWPEATWFPVANGGYGSLSPPIARACIKALGWVAECVEATD